MVLVDRLLRPGEVTREAWHILPKTRGSGHQVRNLVSKEVSVDIGKEHRPKRLARVSPCSANVEM